MTTTNDPFFIVLGHKSDNTVMAFGSPTGRPFTTEASAERWRAKLDRDPRMRGVDLIVLPIYESPK